MKKRNSKKHKTSKLLKESKTPKKNIILIFVRYLILLALMFSLPFIYYIFTPLTVYPLILLLKIFFTSIVLKGSIILINKTIFIEIIPACIAGSAYLLLLILNLSTQINLKKRIYSILFTFAIFLIINILRLFLFSVLYIKNQSLFDSLHYIFWNIMSTIIVILLWFITVKVFSISSTPIYTDFKDIINSIKKK
ncbi:pacearchaeosortase [Candidatus Pacearchaeota archaeon]|nr:pacearchaeosortase [Candidatus Pacearchaeota archaeon]